MIQGVISKLKKDLRYHDMVQRFKDIVKNKDRIPSTIKYFLVWDVDDNEYKIESEIKATYNQIVLWSATIPAKKDEKGEIKIEEKRYV